MDISIDKIPEYTIIYNITNNTIQLLQINGDFRQINVFKPSHT